MVVILGGEDIIRIPILFYKVNITHRTGFIQYSDFHNPNQIQQAMEMDQSIGHANSDV